MWHRVEVEANTSSRAPCANAQQARPLAALEPPIDHRDVTTIMGLLGDIQHDVARIRRLLEDEDGQEEEAAEDDT
jgi:hypothetical protein